MGKIAVISASRPLKLPHDEITSLLRIGKIVDKCFISEAYLSYHIMGITDPLQMGKIVVMSA
jgi:hypothetical protein